jgi:DNA modification methylase
VAIQQVINDVEKLMAGERADMVFTDPPYNLGFKYNSHNDNMGASEYQDFCTEWFNCLKTVTNKIIITPGTKNLPMWMRIDSEVQGIACWVKKNWITSCKISNLQQWEPILFYGPFERSRHSDLYEINRKYQDDVGDKHTCPKQIELIEDIFNSYGQKTILDVFGGSGSTLIACEKTNRKCFMMEIDPHYCDVIVARWEKYTGKKAELVTEETQEEEIVEQYPDVKETAAVAPVSIITEQKKTKKGFSKWIGLLLV